MRRFDAVIFDLFHTLVDPEDFRPPEFRRWPQVAALLGLDSGPLEMAMAAASAERGTSRVSVLGQVRAYARSVGISIDEPTAAAIDDVLGRYQDAALLSPRPEVTAAVAALRSAGLRMAILSDTNEREIRSWPRSPLAPLFDDACFSCDLGSTKSATTSFEVVVERLGTTPERTAFVGDGGIRSGELRTAQDAGIGLVVWMRGFVSSNGLHSQEEMMEFAKVADVTISSIAELQAMLS